MSTFDPCKNKKRSLPKQFGLAKLLHLHRRVQVLLKTSSLIQTDFHKGLASGLQNDYCSFLTPHRTWYFFYVSDIAHKKRQSLA